MADILKSFDHLLGPDGPAAIVIRQWLRSAEGSDAVIFPPTYPFTEDREQKADYNIDKFGDGTSVCIIDTVASQANRIEPAFENIAEGTLIPQVTIDVTLAAGDSTSVNLLAAGHRVADAIARFSDLAPEIAIAIIARKKGDSGPLAKLSPTSLLFGMWDSRGTQEKIPRLLNSVIRAYDVNKLSRSAQYKPVIDYKAAGVVADGDGKDDNKLSVEGMADVPSTGNPGGIVAKGGIRRDASLNLATLGDIKTNSNAETIKLQRYLLGLSLVALTYFDGKVLNLRQGCQLVVDGDRQKDSKRVIVFADGTEKAFSLTRDEAIAYAKAAAQAFGVGENRSAKFNPKDAKASLKKDAKKGKGSEASK
jgi:CRISPR-associated protein Csb1